MKTRILFADDEPDIMATIKLLLEVHGFVVTSAYDGDEAYALAQEDKYDLFLLDVLLPKTLGDDLGKLLQRNPRNAKTPIIFLTNLPLEALTGTPDSQKMPIQRDAKGSLYVRKNCSDEELIAAIKFALKK